MLSTTNLPISDDAKLEKFTPSNLRKIRYQVVYYLQRVKGVNACMDVYVPSTKHNRDARGRSSKWLFIGTKVMQSSRPHEITIKNFYPLQISNPNHLPL